MLLFHSIKLDIHAFVFSDLLIGVSCRGFFSRDSVPFTVGCLAICVTSNNNDSSAICLILSYMSKSRGHFMYNYKFANHFEPLPF